MAWDPSGKNAHGVAEVHRGAALLLVAAWLIYGNAACKRSSQATAADAPAADAAAAPAPSASKGSRHEGGVLHFAVRPRPGRGAGVPPRVAGLPSGDVVLAGHATHGLNLGAGEMDDDTAYVAALSSEGDLRWIHTQREGPTLSALRVDQGGRVLLVADGDAATLTGEAPDGSLHHRLIAFDEHGAHLWSRGCGDVLVLGLAVNARGDILVSGMSEGPVGIDDASYDAGIGDDLLVQLDAKGMPRWTRRFGSLRAAALFDDGGAVVVVEETPRGPSTTPDAALPPGNSLAKLDPSGRVVWTRAVSSEVSVQHVAVDGPDILVAASVSGLGVIAGRPVVGGVQGSMFFGRFDGTGRPRWTRVIDTVDRLNVAIAGWIAPLPNGGALGCGEYGGEIELGDDAGLRRGPAHLGSAVVVLDAQGRTRAAHDLIGHSGYRAVDGRGGLYVTTVVDGTPSPDQIGPVNTFRLDGSEFVLAHVHP